MKYISLFNEIRGWGWNINSSSINLDVYKNNLYRYLEEETPDTIAGIEIKYIEVFIDKKAIFYTSLGNYTSYLVVRLCEDDNKYIEISFALNDENFVMKHAVYSRNVYSGGKDVFCQVIFNDKKSVVHALHRHEKSILNYNLQMSYGLHHSIPNKILQEIIIEINLIKEFISKKSILSYKK